MHEIDVTIGHERLTILAPRTEVEARIMQTALASEVERMGSGGVIGRDCRPDSTWTVSLEPPSLPDLDDRNDRRGWALTMLRITDTSRTMPHLCAQFFDDADAVAPYTLRILCRIAYTADGWVALHIVGDVPAEVRIDNMLWTGHGIMPVVSLV